MYTNPNYGLVRYGLQLILILEAIRAHCWGQTKLNKNKNLCLGLIINNTNLEQHEPVGGLPRRQARLHRARVPILVAVRGVVLPEPVQVALEVVLELRLHLQQLHVRRQRRGLQLLPGVAEVVDLLQVLLAHGQLVTRYDVERFLSMCARENSLSPPPATKIGKK